MFVLPCVDSVSRVYKIAKALTAYEKESTKWKVTPDDNMKKQIDSLVAIARARTYENHILRTLDPAAKKSADEKKATLEKYRKRYAGIDPELLHPLILNEIKKVSGQL